jgi:hypothetical protein
MDFEERLKRAVDRGKRRHASKEAEAEARALSDEELKRLHSQIRLDLSDHIEKCIKRLESHFPGFRTETLYGEKGWGAAASRDDLRLGDGGRRANLFSRLEITVRPFSSYHVVDLQAKGTVRNKEVLTLRHFDYIVDADLAHFIELIDSWVVDYAELFAAS